MALPGNKNFSDYDNYKTEQNPTTSAQAQDYFRNQAELLKAVIDCDFWQPETVYQPGDVVKSDSMPNGTEAVMVATKASVTSNVEPQWGVVGGANISDGACFWKLRWQHWSKEVASVDDMKNGVSDDKIVTPKLARLGQNATNRLPNTAYSVGNVVYVDSNLSVALKCTIAGTTSNTELDISSRAVGESVEDGSVVWKVVSRDTVATIDQQRPLKTFTSLAQLGLDNNASEVDIATAMPSWSCLYTTITGYSNNYPNLTMPKQDGFLYVFKGSGNENVEFNFAYHTQARVVIRKYVAYYTSWLSENKFTGWKQLATNGALSMPSMQNIINLSTSFTANNSNYETVVSYTAPCDGWISVYVYVSNANNHSLGIDINKELCQQVAWGEWLSQALMCPIAKGDLGNVVVYNVSGAVVKFIYAQSEV